MSQMPVLTDPQGRTFPYLRLSLTDVCNYRCSYCLPNGYKKDNGPDFLSVAEIQRLVHGFATLGTWKVRLTGGEPTLRDDFLEIAKTVSSVHGIKKVALTTNGYKLPERAEAYKKAGVTAINISIDSLKPENFARITGHDRLEEALAGVEACKKAGFERIKINAVLLKETAETELDAFIAFAQQNDVSIRFIELMRTLENTAYFNANHVSASTLTRKLFLSGWQLVERQDGAGPAIEFMHKNVIGSIGVIAPYARNFCANCNRLRVSARGDLHLCLFGQGGTSLREHLQHDDQLEVLQGRIRTLLQGKKESHLLHQQNPGTTKHLASIGG